jgi:hypothetical protein
MLTWLYVAAAHASPRCASNLTVYFYDVDYRKHLPPSRAETLGPHHVNSAFANVCAASGEIVVFRHEEWFKVFVHETFHALGLDFARAAAVPLRQKLKSLYGLSIDYAPTEAYSEAWARILNVAFIAYGGSSGSGPRRRTVGELRTFIENLLYMLEVERVHSVKQSNKVLRFMDLSYDMLLDGRDNRRSHAALSYREDTAVFAYYVETAVLLSDFPRFLAFCYKHNLSMFDFRKTPATMRAYTSMYGSVAGSAATRAVMSCVEEGLPDSARTEDSLRMSCFETER